LPSIPLGGNYFSDVGYRYRMNKFHVEDDWYQFHDTADAEFTDYAFFNLDTFEIDPDNSIIL